MRSGSTSAAGRALANVAAVHSGLMSITPGLVAFRRARRFTVKIVLLAGLADSV
jgi:hypothetical protein